MQPADAASDCWSLHSSSMAIASWVLLAGKSSAKPSRWTSAIVSSRCCESRRNASKSARSTRYSRYRQGSRMATARAAMVGEISV
eukprot:7085805-Prymnesium_polylepis.1